MNGQDASIAAPHISQQYRDANAPLPVKLARDSNRVDVDALMNEFRQELGPARWERYRDTLTHFLMGKLSRVELVHCLRDNMGMNNAAIRNHNALVSSSLANACRDPPEGTESSSADWKSTTRGRSRIGMDSADDRSHREVLSSPARERRRIKAIAKEAQNQAKQPLIPPQPPVLVATRHAMSPHIPFVPDTKDARGKLAGSKAINGRVPGSASGDASNGSTVKNGVNGSVSSSAGASGAASSGSAANKDPTPGQALVDPLSNLNPGRSSGPLTWTQDIIQGLDTPSISESHEFPDDSAMGTRMLGMASEHGLLEGIGAGTTDMMLSGLESYSGNIVEQLVSLKHRKFNPQEPSTAEDLDSLVSTRPSEIGEPTAPIFRLRSQFLQDEPTIDAPSASVPPIDAEQRPRTASMSASAPPKIQPSSPSPAKRLSPWDSYQQKRMKQEPDDPESSESKSKLMKEHEQGIASIGDSLG